MVSNMESVAKSSEHIKKTLIGLSTIEIQEWCIKNDLPSWRGKQISEAIYKQQVESIDQIIQLPKNIREKLQEEFNLSNLELSKEFHSSDDVTKCLVHGGDSQVFECVLLPYEDRVSCCLSSQVGCPMGCKFCATGLGGFDRNLTTSEIVSQYLLLQLRSKRRISHVVFMGMGEPLLNYNNLVKAITILHEEIGLSLRHITVSTVGLVPQIKKLTELKLPIHLALSLHSPSDEIRSKLMPVNNRWPVKEVVGTMIEYQKATRRKITIEYLLIDQVNDSYQEADAIGELLQGIPSIVNIIPFNYVDTENGFKRPSNGRIEAFKNQLRLNGLTVTQRQERGHDIAAACGQLAGEHSGRFARRLEKNLFTVR